MRIVAISLSIFLAAYQLVPVECLGMNETLEAAFYFTFPVIITFIFSVKFDSNLNESLKISLILATLILAESIFLGRGNDLEYIYYAPLAIFSAFLMTIGLYFGAIYNKFLSKKLNNISL